MRKMNNSSGFVFRKATFSLPFSYYDAPFGRKRVGQTDTQTDGCLDITYMDSISTQKKRN
jgi:hypothetical protein